MDPGKGLSRSPVFSETLADLKHATLLASHVSNLIFLATVVAFLYAYGVRMAYEDPDGYTM